MAAGAMLLLVGATLVVALLSISFVIVIGLVLLID
jgi:hypothetical protein